MHSPEPGTRLRLAHVLNTLGRGGVPQVAYALLARQPQHHRFLYCLRSQSGEPAAGVERAAARELAAAGVTVRFADAPDKAALVQRIAAWLHSDRIDLAHTHSYKPNRYARLAAVEAGVPVVAHYHNTYADKWSVDGSLPLERRLARASAGLVACSVAVREQLTEWTGVSREAVTVVLNGVDPPRYRRGDGRGFRHRLGVPSHHALVGTVGRLCAQKAPEDFLHAARLIADRRDDTSFVLVGDADQPETLPRLLSLTRDLGLAGRVHFPGYVSNVADVYAALDVFALPSRWEGFGLVLAEAMAAGTPIVTTDVGPVPEVVGCREDGSGGAALLVPPSNPTAMARQVLRLLADPGLASDLVVAGLSRAERFSWDVAAGRMEVVYAAALERAGQPAGGAAAVACAHGERP